MTQFDTQRMLVFTYNKIRWNCQSAFVELVLLSKAFTIYLLLTRCAIDRNSSEII